MSTLSVLEGDMVEVLAGLGFFFALAYIMLGISTLCEEYFVASLSVVVEVFNIPPEVAGATLMAAGTSSPELFAAIIGLFFSSNSATGISTVVGSVVFNTLMIIGFSIWVSPTGVIKLATATFVRECVFYFAALVMLYISFGDGEVVFWEGFAMVLLYIAYVLWCYMGDTVIAYTRASIDRMMGLSGPQKHAETAEEVQALVGVEKQPVLTALLGEARVLLAVFYQNCVLTEFFQRVPARCANHPAVLEYALAWVQSGALQPLPPSYFPGAGEYAALSPRTARQRASAAFFDLNPEHTDGVAAALSWLEGYAPGDLAKVDAPRSMAEALRAVRGQRVPRAALGRLLAAKLRALGEWRRSGPGGALPVGLGPEEVLAALGLLSGDEEEGGAGALGAAAVPMARVAALLEEQGAGWTAGRFFFLRAERARRLGRAAAALEEVLGGGHRWRDRGFLRGGDRPAALAAATEAKVLVPSDVEAIKLAATVTGSDRPREPSGSARGGGGAEAKGDGRGDGGGQGGQPRGRFPFAQLVALAFLWGRHRSKFFSLSPRSEADAESTLQDKLSAYGDQPRTQRMFSVDDMVDEHVLGKDHDPLRMPAGGGLGEVLLWAAALPFAFLYSVTIPDCKKPKLKKFYAATLLLSTVWLSVLTFCMIRTAESIGQYWKLNPALLGFTLLAAGTSFPDFFSSVVVAKYGDGDMAVSNALGSNNFDILFGLGLPVVLKVLLYGEPEKVKKKGLTQSIIILVGLLLLLILVVVAGKFKLTKPVGTLFIVLYICYVSYCLVEFLGW